MHSRRAFLAGSSAALLPLAACSATGDYAAAVASERAPLPLDPTMLDLVRLATLAPNGHNAQPWQFKLGAAGASIRPDSARRTPVVDPDDHHLFVSLGAAAENFLLAARAAGRPGAMTFERGHGGRIDLDLANGPIRDEALAAAIPARQSTRSNYDGRAVPMADLRQMLAAASTEGVSCTAMTAPAQREAVLGFVTQGNGAQMDDPAFVRELRDWVRFNPEQALRHRDGLYSASSGNPTLPAWLGEGLFGMVFSKKSENDKYAGHLRSSAGIAVFVGDRADPDHWVRVGRSFQRFALQATALGIRTAMINQPVEVPAVRAEFARWLGIGGARPDLVVRFGYAPPLPMSLRRAVATVIVA